MERLKEVGWLFVQTLLAWALILVESCVIMSTDESTTAFQLEPLRILCLFMTVFVFLISLLIFGHPLRRNLTPKSEKIMNSIIMAFLATWAFINLEITLQWKQIHVITDIKLLFSVFVQIVKQLAINHMLIRLITYRILRPVALVCPALYYLLRCKLYSVDIIESVILVLFPLIAGIALLGDNSVKSRANKGLINYTEQERIEIETKTLKKEKISIIHEKKTVNNENNTNFERKQTRGRAFKDFPKEIILDKLPDGMAVINSEGKFEYFNDSISKLLNCPQDEAIEKLLSLPNKSALERKDERTTKIVKKAETAALFPSKTSHNSLSSLTFIGRDLKETRNSRASNSNVKAKFQEETAKDSVDKELKSERERYHKLSIRGISKLLFGEKNDTAKLGDTKKDDSPMLPKLLKSVSNMGEAKRIASNKKNKKEELLTKFETGSFTQIVDHENIDQYFENIFNDQFESDHSDVRGTLEHVLKLLTDLRDYFFEGTEDENHVSPRDLKIRMRYSATGFSRKDRFFRKFTMCSSFAVSVESFVKLERKTRTLEILINPMIVEGDVYLLLQLRDISNKAMLKQVKEINRQQSSSLAAIIHEFRSPLGGVLSMLEVLKPQIAVELQEKFLQPALTSASSLLYLVNDILDLHQMKAKELRLVFKSCSLAEICENSMSMIRFKADKRGVALESNMSDNIPKLITTDPNRLQQILVNLLSNAIKFTESGKISIEATYLPDKKIKLQVRDTGIGIERENLKKLFKSFGKIDLGTQNHMNPQGAGLGLFISHGLAKRLNSSKGEGGLAVASVLGEGTCFSFIIDDIVVVSENVDFPDEVETKKMERMLTEMNKSISFNIHKESAAKSDNELALRLNPPQLLKNPSDKTEKTNTCSCAKVLIVDDNELNIWALESQLKSFHITHVDSARNGEEAVQKFIEKSSQKLLCCSGCYALILMDCEMPVKNGLVATKEIRERAKLSCSHNHRIIGVSGYSSAEFIKRCLEVGMDEVITKPIRNQDIKHILKTVNIS